LWYTYKYTGDNTALEWAKNVRKVNTAVSNKVGGRTDRTLSNQVYEALKKEIINCWLSPAQMVYANELAQRYQVSKVPVREAIKRLMQDGLIHSIPGIGNVVAPITLKDIRDLFEMRRILETAAIQRAAEISTEEQLVCIEKLVGESYLLDSEDSHIRWHRGNVEFHVAIAAISNNERLVRSVRSIMEEMSRVAHMNLGMRADSSSMVTEHQEILNALRLRDGDLATRQAMLAIDGALRLVQQSLAVAVQN
jgi:DNA-binding GntR family transcriptional regulator